MRGDPEQTVINQPANGDASWSTFKRPLLLLRGSVPVGSCVHRPAQDSALGEGASLLSLGEPTKRLGSNETQMEGGQQCV